MILTGTSVKRGTTKLDSYAEKLGDFPSADVLQETLEDEAQADRHLKAMV